LIGPFLSSKEQDADLLSQFTRRGRASFVRNDLKKSVVSGVSRKSNFMDILSLKIDGPQPGGSDEKKPRRMDLLTID